MKSLKLFVLSVVFLGLTFTQCGNNDAVKFDDNFDRQAMLMFWADDIIVPSFEAYASELESFQSATSTFFDNPNESNYDLLTSAWLEAYKAWQHVSMFDIGKAEEISLRSYTNIYPSDSLLIEDNVNSGNYNLILPSNYDAQGFPALDYLLFGLAESKSEIISNLSQEKYSNYFKVLVERLRSLNNEVLDDWTSNFKTQFIANDGSSATASVDKLVNDFLFYYEKFVRAGKVGIPAGVFSGSENSNSVEAPYSGVYSKELFQDGFSAVQKFFSGVSFDGSTNGSSLQGYLDHITEFNSSAEISRFILDQWENIDTKLMAVDDNFKLQVEMDNLKMLELYDELQKAVVLLKVDMMCALNIQVDFVDADGD